ncbi:hypothetical protein JVT61DRAFT_470 [Boletus reticuloceps]|uniref:Peptide hydrolase n=1 Tax=Boletus reticuloceps TaxID=495285 RepID=A0A8I3ADS9_9AGAM|nr:hypothetical protein JVT61DRAFT_470 [Boletus reticuloceps]
MGSNTLNAGSRTPFLGFAALYVIPPIHTAYTQCLPHIPLKPLFYHTPNTFRKISDYRTPGTREHADADAWMVRKAEEIKQLCEEFVKKEEGRKLECEIWRQEGSGSHRFDMMNARLYKTYVNLSNIIIRISDGTERGKASAVLINSHLDSTLPSPGAADDGLAVGVMLECARVLVETKGWEPTYSIIFLFNNAEESLQDGSHLFSTQHPLASTSVISLSADILRAFSAGTTGRELLFQATSEEMIEAYSHVPRPHGTIFANEIFSSGVLLSDTDFRQFEYYLNVTGLDMAVVGNSYMYHMRGDLVENIQPGVAQHMAENSLALLRFLSSDASPIPRLEHGFARPRTVFFSNLGLFTVYSFTTAKIMYVTLLGASFYIVRTTGVKRVWTAFGAVVSAFVGALIGANGVALVMANILHKGMSWFKAEYFPVVLYWSCSALISQLPFSKAGSNNQTLEKPMLAALLLFQSGLAAVGQLFNIGSSVAPFLGATGMFVALGVDALLAQSRRTSDANHASKENGADKATEKRALDGTTQSDVSLWIYAVAMVIPLITGTQLLSALLVVFVPLTGRIGGDAPSEFIIASMVTILGAFTISFVVPFAHRFGPATLRRALVLAILALGVAMAFFYNQVPFDRKHQKRLFVIHMEDLVTQEQHLHIAAADGAPGFVELVHDIADEFGADNVPPKPITMDDYNNDWDSLYPFSAFLAPYKVDLPLDPAYAAPQPPGERFSVTAVNDTIDELAGTRKFTLRIDHPGIIWTVIAFDAHVLEWTLDNNPPDEFARHHIKEASFYGTDTWTVSMTIKHPSARGEESATTGVGSALKIDFVGIKEKRMWPGKRAESDGSQAMKLFQAFDTWIDEKTGGAVDPMLLGCIRGESVI